MQFSAMFCVIHMFWIVERSLILKMLGKKLARLMPLFKTHIIYDKLDYLPVSFHLHMTTETPILKL